MQSAFGLDNHHDHQASARMGFFWWEVDVSYAVLRALSWFGLVWGLRRPPRAVIEADRVADGNPDVGMLAPQE